MEKEIELTGKKLHIENNEHEIEIGQWYWTNMSDDKSDRDYVGLDGAPEGYNTLSCVTHIGSNYVKLRTLNFPSGGYRFCRVHIDDFENETLFEPNHKFFFNKNIKFRRDNLVSLMGEVRELHRRLGMPTNDLLSQPTHNPDTTALTIKSNNLDVKSYSNALEKAKNVELPALFEKIKLENSRVASLLTADVIALEAEASILEESISLVDQRIFNVSLYAGLIEQLELIQEGEPAKYHEKVHLMQRCLYMDEECLVSYKAGGMEFKEIFDFEDWLKESENFERCLPYPKTIVAFRVRRHEKKRNAKTPYERHINVELAKEDENTFLYIRNGQQLYRLSTDLDFDHMIFPDITYYDPNVPLMMKYEWSKVERFMTVASYEKRLEDNKENDRKYKEWKKENPEEDHWRNPYSNTPFEDRNWHPFNRSSVYYDEGIAKQKADMDRYNRIALLVQGILDRSEALHPHPPISNWNQESFNAMIELVYDGNFTLYDGEKPNIEKYIEGCNKQITEDSYFYGQFEYWVAKETEKENKRRDKMMRYDDDLDHTDRWIPTGNAGVSQICKASKMNKNKTKITFTWKRVFLGNSSKKHRRGDLVDVSITVPVEKLFNVSAYKSGDYKQFYQDPRTRSDYLSWAELLLSSEDFIHGKWNEDNKLTYLEMCKVNDWEYDFRYRY